MKAYVTPLKGKYYGTTVDIPGWGHINVWLQRGLNPSDRELDGFGLTREQWDKNEEVDDGCGGRVGCQGADLICDSHYESQESYRVACACAEAIQNLNLKETP